MLTAILRGTVYLSTHVRPGGTLKPEDELWRSEEDGRHLRPPWGDLHPWERPPPERARSCSCELLGSSEAIGTPKLLPHLCPSPGK